MRHREVGMGKSKKIAKRQAAYKMWQKLQESPLDQSDIIQSLDEDGNEEVSDWKGFITGNFHRFRINFIQKLSKSQSDNNNNNESLANNDR